MAGGGPLAYVIAYDLSASADGHATEPARISRSKTAIRRRLMRSVPTREHFNPLHSSDNPRQALEYLDLLGDAGLLDRLRARIDEIRAEMQFPYPVIQLLPSGRRRALIATLQSGADLVARQAMQFLVLLVLARLVTPADFGTVALLAVFVTYGCECAA